MPDLSRKFLANLLDALLLQRTLYLQLVALPFAVNKAYFELIFNGTSSLHSSGVLRK